MHLQAREIYNDQQEASARQLVDFIFTNTRLNLGVEIVVDLDAEGVKEHVQVQKTLNNDLNQHQQSPRMVIILKRNRA